MKQGFVLFLFFLTVASCTPHRSFVATPYEPVTVEKKGDIEAFAGSRGLKYYTLGFTAATSDFMAVRASYGGFLSLHTLNLSVILFKNYTRFGFFAAPVCIYQRNYIDRSLNGYKNFGRDKSYHYNCEYLSPGAAIGVKLFTGKRISHQLILKAQYNLVNKYEYHYKETNPQQPNPGYRTIYKDETFRKNIPSFFSFEPSYVFLHQLDDYFSLKYQLSSNICQVAYQHSYSYISHISSHGFTGTEGSVSNHPQSLPVNFSFGLIFKASLSRKKDPSAQN